MSHDTTNDLEVIDNNNAAPSMSALESMERASIDMQVATAKRYPRDLKRVKAQMLSFATLDEDTAKSCFYVLPPRAGGDGKAIKGPSVRLAEIALSSYQHLRAGARVISNDGKVIVAQGVVHDLENNVLVSIERRRSITKKNGQAFSADMQAVASNAICSIALRDATFRVVPMALIKPVYEAAMKTAVGDAKTLVQRRADCLAHFAKLGVVESVILAALGLTHRDNITIEHIETLIGYATAIKDGEVEIDEVFKPAAASAPSAPGPQVLSPATIKALETVFGGDVEPLVNNYLVHVGRIKEGSTFRALSTPDANHALKESPAIIADAKEHAAKASTASV